MTIAVGLLYTNQGLALYQLAEYPAALTAYEQAITYFEQSDADLPSRVDYV